jgi:hypothetical protein
MSFETSMAVYVHISHFIVMTPCSLVGGYIPSTKETNMHYSSD